MSLLLPIFVNHASNTRAFILHQIVHFASHLFDYYTPQKEVDTFDSDFQQTKELRVHDNACSSEQYSVIQKNHNKQKNVEKLNFLPRNGNAHNTVNNCVRNIRDDFVFRVL